MTKPNYQQLPEHLGSLPIPPEGIEMLCWNVWEKDAKPHVVIGYIEEDGEFSFYVVGDIFEHAKHLPKKKRVPISNYNGQAVRAYHHSYQPVKWDSTAVILMEYGEELTRSYENLMNEDWEWDEHRDGNYKPMWTEVDAC